MPQQRTDFLLDLLIAAWQELPTVEQEIGRWDLVEQIDYVEEWAPKEVLLDELERYAAADVLTTQQRRRYGELQRLMAENRPILARLRES